MVGPGQSPFGVGVAELTLYQLRLGLDLQAGQHELHLVAVAAEAGAADLEHRRRRLAAHPADPHPVGPRLGQRDGVEAGGDVGARVAGTADLVEQLRGDGAQRDRATGTRVLGDHTAAVRVHLRQRKARMAEIGDLGEEGVVAAGGLRAAFEHVPGHHGPGQRVIVRSPPAEVGRGRPHHQRGIGDPAGDHHVGAAVQAFDDAPGAEVGIGRHRAPQPQLLGAREQVVARDMGHLGVQPEPPRQLTDGERQAVRVEPTGIGDDLHPPVERGAEGGLQLAQEGLGVAAVGVLEPVAPQDEHGQLGQVVAGQDVQLATGQHLVHRGEAVAVEARGIADAKRLPGCGIGHVQRSHRAKKKAIIIACFKLRHWAHGCAESLRHRYERSDRCRASDPDIGHSGSASVVCRLQARSAEPVYGARLRSRGMRSKTTARRAAWSKNWVTREVSDSRWARVSVPR